MDKNIKKIKTALISVFHKENLDGILDKLSELGVNIISTGGTKQFIKEKGIKVQSVEDITEYPSILGGRVKTLHPRIFGGILTRRDNTGDIAQNLQYEIPEIDLVIVDLYPFEKTVESGAEEHDIIEKIDIGGISLIRAAAKNYKDVLVVSSQEQYSELEKILVESGAETTIEQRRRFATYSFSVSSNYDAAIFNYFNAEEGINVLRKSLNNSKNLRYGENPHQKAVFFGNFDDIFEQVQGKEISYNNLLDIDAAVGLISEFNETCFAVLKHNNACGIAVRENLTQAWEAALAGDPISAFGGVLITNREIDLETANEVNKLFFEVIIAPAYNSQALEILKSKKNRIILIQKKTISENTIIRTSLNGVLVQEKDMLTAKPEDIKFVTDKTPDKETIEELIFAEKIVKHTKSNAIVLTKNKQLCASGIGQTSRVDALKQAIAKAGEFNLEIKGAVMASDAFFPFADCVEIANKAGIISVIQPGGSVKDKDSIEYCNKNNISMVFTGTRHFKH